jgi:hypothetical protein
MMMMMMMMMMMAVRISMSGIAIVTHVSKHD